MKNIVNVTLWLNDTRKNNDGLCTIFVRLTLREKKTIMSTGISVPENLWDANKMRVMNCYPDAGIINEKLSIILDKTNLYIEKLKSNERLNFMTVTRLKECVSNYLKVSENPILFLEIFQRFVDKKRIDSVHHTYNTVFKRVRTFVEVEQHLNNLNINDVDVKWLLDFESYLRFLNFKHSSIMVYMKILRIVINQAYEKDLILFNPFKRVKLRYNGNRVLGF